MYCRQFINGCNLEEFPYWLGWFRTVRIAFVSGGIIKVGEGEIGAIENQLLSLSRTLRNMGQSTVVFGRSEPKKSYAQSSNEPVIGMVAPQILGVQSGGTPR